MLLPLTQSKAELIQAVRITDPARHMTSPDLTGDIVAVWESDQVQRLLTLIAGLPAGEPRRCFHPGWGIRVHGAAGQLFEIAFCFSCHNARIWGPDLPVEQQSQAFDAESPGAVDLLRRFRSCVPG